MTILYVFIALYCGTTNPFMAIFHPLYIFGMWKLFTKCGEKGWKAFIPFYDTYVLARLAGSEPEGRMAFVTSITTRFSIALMEIPFTNELIVDLATVMLLVSSLVEVVFIVRIYIAVCGLFERKRVWILGWLFSSTIVSLIWGLKKEYKPIWIYEDVESKIDNYFTGASAHVMNDGLTVNIVERTAKEFLTRKRLLRDIHMNIAPGHMVLLLGGSGAGKTTLVNAINGYEKAKAEIYLNGGNIYNDYRRMKYEIGFVPQLDLMRGKDTVLHTLRDAAQLRLPQEFSIQDRHKRVDEVMNIFGLAPVKNNMVDKLSGGQRKRLSIAMEFISNPSLFILDEPDSGLDGVMARELMEQLRHIADQGKIVIVITHTPDRVIDLFDDVIVLAKDSSRTGRLAYFGPIAEARDYFNRPTMERIVMSINRKEEGGDGLADEFIKKFVEVQHARA